MAMGIDSAMIAMTMMTTGSDPAQINLTNTVYHLHLTSMTNHINFQFEFHKKNEFSLFFAVQFALFRFLCARRRAGVGAVREPQLERVSLE